MPRDAQVLLYAVKITVLLLSLPVHEACHALMAHLLGDDTAKHLGRISLNPLRHLDPWGTLMMLIPGSVIGWAKPTPFNPLNLRGSRSLGSALIYIAGPLSNLVVAALTSLIVRLLLLSGFGNGTAYDVLEYFIFINLCLFLFNLIPIPPLDGFGALSQIAAGEFKYTLASLQRLGFPILLVVLLADRYSGFNFIGNFIGGTASAIGRFLLPAAGG